MNPVEGHGSAPPQRGWSLHYLPLRQNVLSGVAAAFCHRCV
jgi:hypothetical protein